MLELEPRTLLPRVKDCSLRVWVLVVPAMWRVGLPDGEGWTESFLLNSEGLGAVLGGVIFLAEVGLGRQVLAALEDDVEAVSSSLVNVPCLTMAGLS